MGHPKPKFASFGVVAQSIFYVGSNSDHIKILFSQGKKNINAIGFGMGKKLKGLLNPGDLVDVAFEVEINEWNGNKSLQIKILDIKK
jgi:single-stranded-DNA-specific exonuclease